MTQRVFILHGSSALGNGSYRFVSWSRRRSASRCPLPTQQSLRFCATLARLEVALASGSARRTATRLGLERGRVTFGLDWRRCSARRFSAVAGISRTGIATKVNTDCSLSEGVWDLHTAWFSQWAIRRKSTLLEGLTSSRDNGVRISKRQTVAGQH